MKAFIQVMLAVAFTAIVSVSVFADKDKVRKEITFANDRRKLFFGKQLDHIFVRGLAMVDSSATEVTSSDHNPVAATLRLP